jgi:hypothetical protein
MPADTNVIRQGSHRSVLSLRKGEGGLRIVGEAPDVHLLASSFIERELAEGNVEVHVTIKHEEGELVYKLVDYQRDDEGVPNRSEWIVERVS